jgi:hypothetical protein
MNESGILPLNKNYQIANVRPDTFIMSVKYLLNFLIGRLEMAFSALN